MTELLTAARGGDGQAEEELIKQNSGLIWSIARRYFGRGIDPDDLYQLGCVGFIKAMRGFDPDYGTCFSTYAVPKISGEIRRFIRDDGSVKVSRGIKERAAALRLTKSRLEQSLGRAPVLSELSAETGMSPEEIAICETAAAGAESLQQQTGPDGLTLEQVLGDSSQEERMVEHIALRDAVDRLPEKERTVILLRYWKGLTQEQCARVAGVSQVQVSRMERRAVDRLRQYLSDP
ncbi:MAG: sigma-70 family RNA polymerase sigma factor [Oscillospiraceae bacterium]|nr:sigma-70 family RNA polymerase sigma factor [Oscillospiraceae bacterium]